VMDAYLLLLLATVVALLLVAVSLMVVTSLLYRATSLLYILISTTAGCEPATMYGRRKTDKTTLAVLHRASGDVLE